MMKTMQLLTFAVFARSIPVKHSEMTLPGELHDELDTALKNVSKEAEREKILLKDTRLRHSYKTVLGELVVELEKAVKHFSDETEGKSIFLTEVKMNGCKHEVFCQAEQVLIKEVSGLPGARFDRFRIDNKLMRNLNMYNKHHVKTCKPANETDVDFLLHFLENLLRCVKTAYSQANIPVKHSEMTLPGELHDELDTAMKNVPKETEREKILLKDTPVRHNDKTFLAELVFELEKAVKHFSDETEGTSIFLTEVKMNGCKHEVFCQAEQVLIKEVSGLPGARFDRFRIDNKLMRNLNMYNKHHVKTCKPADETDVDFLLHFLENLLKCVKTAYSQANIPVKHSEMTLPGELHDELDTAMKNVPKETEREKILLKDTPVRHNDKTFLAELVFELEKAVKHFSDETEGTSIFLTEVKMNGCKHEVFCQAEQVLIKEVSGLPGARFDRFRIDKKLMRNLNMYNKHHVKTCKPANETDVDFLLHFLENLLRCVKTAYSQANIPVKHSEMTLPGELHDELDTAMKNVPKETEREKILLKDTPVRHNDKTFLAELVFELEKAVKHFSDETEGKSIFLTEVKMNGCKHEVFCLAEQVLIKEVSGLSGARFDRFRIDNNLMRNLNMYNKHHVKTCKPADETVDLLLHFLENLLRCVKTAYSQAK